MGTLTLNRMPAPTWNRLKLNDAQTDEPVLAGSFQPETQIPQGIACSGGESRLGIRGGVGEELTGLLGKSGVTYYTLEGSSDMPARLDITADSGSKALGVQIDAKPGTRLTVIMHVCDLHQPSDAVLQTLVNAEKGAEIKLVQLFDLTGTALINDVGAKVGDDAHFELTQIFVGGKRTISGVHTELSGYRSGFGCNIGYMLGGSDSLDINLTARHTGKKSRSAIEAKGVLSDSSGKIFRGTIDFIKGAAGAVGAETEDVLLMNEKVLNKTVPVILCEEEDVEGSHGASIGRLDEKVIYYMMSRGIPLEMVYKLTAASKIDYMIRKAGDERIMELASEAVARRSADV